MIVCVEEILSW